jgi:hypothetical protein
VGSNPTLSASQFWLAVLSGRETKQNSGDFAEVFAQENPASRFHLLSIGLGERIFLRNLYTSTAGPVADFIEARMAWATPF